MYQVSVDDDDVWCWSPIRCTINMMWQFRRFSRRYWLWHWRGSTWPNPITPPPRGRWCRNGITPGDWDVDAGNRESWKQFAKSSRLPIAHQDYNAVMDHWDFCFHRDFYKSTWFHRKFTTSMCQRPNFKSFFSGNIDWFVKICKSPDGGGVSAEKWCSLIKSQWNVVSCSLKIQ